MRRPSVRIASVVACSVVAVVAGVLALWWLGRTAFRYEFSDIDCTMVNYHWSSLSIECEDVVGHPHGLAIGPGWKAMFAAAIAFVSLCGAVLIAVRAVEAPTDSS